jgi:hypothetical protein
MTRKLLIAAGAVFCGAAGLAQVRITSFQPDRLTWTNAARAGTYRVEWADSLGGQWKPFQTSTNLNSIWAQTNRVTVQLPPQSNQAAFYRVVWAQADPAGTWDYRAYDGQGTLVVTGSLTLRWTSNSPYTYYGWRELKYAGSPTNNIGYAGYQVGTGGISAHWELGTSTLSVEWPTNLIDYSSGPGGTLFWPNTFTGRWSHSSIVGPIPLGAFEATKR